jgi:hypothetical protein
MPTIRNALLATAKLLLVLVVLASLAQAAEFVRPRPGVDTDPGSSAVVGRAAVFRVKGSVKGLYPGATKKLRVTVTNPNAFVIVVTRVGAAVRSPDQGCAAKNVKITPWHGRARVSARAHRRMKLAVRMKPGTPDACQGERFRIRFGGTAVRA